MHGNVYLPFVCVCNLPVFFKKKKKAHVLFYLIIVFARKISDD